MSYHDEFEYAPGIGSPRDYDDCTQKQIDNRSNKPIEVPTDKEELLGRLTAGEQLKLSGLKWGEVQIKRNLKPPEDSKKTLKVSGRGLEFQVWWE